MQLISELDQSEQEKIQSAAKVENDVEYTRFSTNDVSVVIEVGKVTILADFGQKVISDRQK